MPIYKQTTEITNIDDLLSSVERDIEEVYFGDKNVFTVWAEYDGTLPAQYSANGSTLADYRIYGSAGGVGNRTENCLEIRDGNFTKTSGTTNLAVTVINGVITFDGTVFELPSAMAEWKSNLDFYIDAGTYYITEPSPLTSGFGRYIKKYDDNSNIVSPGTTVFTLSERTHVYLSFYIYDKIFDNTQVKITLVEGSTAPASYVPYGYEIDMSVSTANLLDCESGWQARLGDGTITGDNTTGTLTISAQYWFQKVLKVKPNTTYTLHGTSNAHTITVGYGVVGAQNDVPDLSDLIFWSYSSNITRSFNTGARNEIAILLNCGTSLAGETTYNELQLEENDSFPGFVPYSTTTTKIYIGSDPLGEDEYISYSEQKVYRRTENVLSFDALSSAPVGIIKNAAGAGYTANHLLNLQLKANTTYIFKSNYNPDTGGKVRCIYVRDAERASSPAINNNVTITTNSTGILPIAFFDNRVGAEEFYNSTSYVMGIEGSTAPAQYIPYLQPTDPPAPLPALPTYNGITITDYAGQSAAVPSRFVAKYRKEGF